LDERWGIDTSIPEIETNQAPIEYYNMQGIRTEHPIPGQLYIRKQGEQASCVLFGH
jgi:hypothetical protein